MLKNNKKLNIKRVVIDSERKLYNLFKTYAELSHKQQIHLVV